MISEKMLPMGEYEYVTATFAAADTETVIPYSIIKPENPENVRWLDVSPGTGRVYRSVSTSRKAFGTGYVVLSSTVAGTTRILLFVERT